MKSLLRRHRRTGSIGLAVIAATAALSLILMLGTVFTPSSQPRNIGAQAATIATLYPVADTMIKQDSPNNNYGSTSPLSCQGNDQRIAYIKFDLAEFVNQRIISAKLQLKLTNDGGSSGDQYIEHVKSSAWQENTLTYNMVYSGSNADLKPSTVLASLEGGAANALIEIPVTQIVSQESGKMITFACVPKELSDSDDFKFFSKEASSGKPALVVEYEPKPSPSVPPTAGPTLQPTSVTGSPGGFGGITLGQTVSGIIYITLYTDQASTAHVKFYIDSTFINDEFAYPYSLGGDTNGAVNGYDTRQLTNGPHILKAEIYYKDGDSEIYQVNFNVQNTPSPTPTCIPVPLCMYPGANPACAYKPPPGGWMCPMVSLTPTCVPLPSPCGDPNVSCKLPALPNGGTYCMPSPTPTCIPLPSCAWPGSNPVCSLAPPPAGGSYCSAPTFTPTPTCSPRPACLDTEPRCLLADPIGGWCPLTPTPTKFCPTATPPLCPTGSSIVSDGVDTNGCGKYKCGPTPTPTPNTISITPCGSIAAPTNLTPEGTAPAGNTTLQWSTQPSAVNYALRIDDLADEFLYTYNSSVCTATNPNDVCVDNLTSGSYPFNLKAGHTYRWWVHAINSCGNWSVSGSAQVAVVNPTPTTTTPSTFPTDSVSKINWDTPWVQFKADGFYILVNNKYYYGSLSTLQLHSDPADSGDPDYTTLEASWTENNYPVKVNFYFRKDGTNWWTEKIAVTDGNTPSNWIYLQDFGPYLKNTLHTPFNYSGDFIQSTTGLTIYFKNPTILPFLPQQITIPPVSVTIIDPSNAFCAQKPKGDANCDNKVDMIDFEIWRQEFIGTDTAKDADFDTSSKVDLVDFESWRQGFVANF